MNAMETHLQVQGQSLHFVTGRLAEHALRDILAALTESQQFCYSIQVLPITVAALMTPKWVARHIEVPADADAVVLPGYCQGDILPLQKKISIPVHSGPRDLRNLPEFLGAEHVPAESYGDYSIEILAEINHAPRLSLAEVLAIADQLRNDGADLIDVGCNPGESWSGVASCVKALRDEGHRVSIDSLNPAEIEPAVQAGAELVLSVNSTNRQQAIDWGCPVVVIPDDPATLGGLEETVEELAIAGVPLRIDPILEPIGFGFAESLQRYWSVRQKFPDAEMLMGTGNLTEMTDVDSAGVNVLLLAICEELSIHSVLTTEVINWSRSSVKECDLARRLVHYSLRQQVPPKHLEPKLVSLRDPQVHRFGKEHLQRLAEDIKDRNYRLFVEDQTLHLVSAGLHLSNEDPFLLFEQLMQGEGQQDPPTNVDASHAFYLGYEMAKAMTAATLSKQYQQDQSLDWGYLTRPEKHHRLKISGRRAQLQTDADLPESVNEE